MNIRYFAWLRERVGTPEEDIAFPAHVVTIADAIAHLATLGEGYAYAFENPALIRAALDRQHAKPETALGAARELALFPPMTGG